MAAPHPPNEQERLQALREYQILRTPPEAAFDEITRSAQRICATPIALLSLVDERCQWFKSHIGVDISETPRDVAFCSYAILQPDVLVVPDTLDDERFADNPLVTSAPHIRFYAGAPLLTPSGHAIGTLCVIDYAPRQLSSSQIAALEKLSRQTVNLLQQRRNQLTAATKADQQQQRQRQQNRFLRRIAAGSGLVFATIVAIGTASYLSTAKIIINEQWAAHTAEVLVGLERITSDIKDAEISAQSYALTGQQSFLMSYKAADTATLKHLDNLKKLTADAPQQQQSIATLSPLVNRKLAFLKQIVQAPDRPDFAENRVLTEKLNRVLLEVEREEQIRLEHRSELNRLNIYSTNLILLSGCLIILGIVGAIYYQIYLETLQRRQTEDALELQRDFTDTVLDTAKALVVVLDCDGRVLRLNRTCEQVTGYSLADVQGQYVWSYFSAPEDREALKADYAQPRAEQFPNQRERAWITKNGDRRWINWSNTAIVDSHGKVEYIIKTGIDVTQRRQVEAERDRFFSLSPDMFCIANINGYCDRLNSAWEKVLGWSLDEMQTQRFIRLVHPDDRKATLQHTRKLLAKEVASFENRCRCKDGSYRWLLWNAVLYNNKIYAVAHNITDRKQVEEQTYRALAREKELGELKSRFVSIVSHEFRTPLTTILASAELLDATNAKLTAEKRERYCSRIRSSVKRMTKLLEDVLLIGRASAGNLSFNPAPLDLESFCRDLMAEFELTIGQQHRLVFSVPTDAAQVHGSMDARLLCHIFMNLLSNAIKYSPEGGTIRFELQYHERTAIFTVRDQGIGIPPQDLNQLFTPFQRSSNVGTIAGTGLGLSIVKTAVDLHSGTIAVDSKLGAGTAFTVTLPLDSQT